MGHHIDTFLAQIGNRNDEKTGAITTPIYLSSTYAHPALGESTGFDYTRTANPTRSVVEEALAKLEGGSFAVATSSGMAAIQLVMSLFKTGDHIITSHHSYGGSLRYFDLLIAQQGITFSFWDDLNSDISALITPETKAIWIETPTNPLMLELDIAAIAKIAHKHDILVCVDNTFYTPLLQQPLQLGADIVVHSATKYLSGHNDVLAGAVICNDDALAKTLGANLNTTGATLAPFDCFLLIRGLKTLALRMAKHQENAQALFNYLSTHPSIEQVYYPGQGGMLSFSIKDASKVGPLLSSLTVFSFAESLGSVESLITYPLTQTHVDMSAEDLAICGIDEHLLRLSVGIEDSADLIADLKQALESEELL